MEMWLWFIIGGLATFRVSAMISTEEGPFRIFERFRNLFTEPNWIGRGVRCFLCLSFWIGPVVALFLWVPLNMTLLTYPIISLALSGLAIVIWRK